jgi:hypothetical protein
MAEISFEWDEEKNKRNQQLKPGDEPTAEQLERIKQAVKLPLLPDEDSPVYTAEQLAFLYAESKRMNSKQTAGISR